MVKPKKKKKLDSKYFLPIVGGFYFIVLFLVYYFTLPVINVGSLGFYFILALVLGFVLSVILVLLSDKFIDKYSNKKFTQYKYQSFGGTYIKTSVSSKEYFSKNKMIKRGILYSFFAVLIFVIAFAIIGSKLFQAKAYYSQLEIVEAPESELKETFDFDSGNVLLPIIDKDLAFKLAQASLGDYGAQYTIDYDNFTLISVTRNGKSELVRIAPLEYSNVFVSLSKMNEGTIGYIEVNVVTKQTTLVEVEGGLKYMPTGLFGKDLDRHIRFSYPTEMYDEYNFEIDDEGNPYWIIPTYKKAIGLINGPTPKQIMIVNPVDGTISKYNIGDEPSWVDRTVDESIVDSQATNALRYKHGFFNVHMGEKKDVFQLSDGYNYFIKDGQTYYVSCITSPNEADQTSIGFVTINLKTKKATKYYVNGITEMRAREIAMNDARVRAQQLEATWPILINYQGVETYFIVLKNEVQSQKKVLINVEDGEFIAMGDTLEQTEAEYDKILADSGEVVTQDINISGIVSRIRDLGDSIEFTIEGINDKYFVVNPQMSIDARFIQVGDSIDTTCKDYTTYYYVMNLKRK